MKHVALLLLLIGTGTAQKIPVDSFQYDGKTWKLETVLRIIDSDCTEVGPCWGITYCQKFSYDHRRRLVRVVYDAPEWESQRDILFHELQHVVEGCTDLPTTQHHAIYDVSQPMMRLLRDPKNKELREWLFGAE